MIYELVKNEEQLSIFLKGHLTFSDYLVFREITEHMQKEKNSRYLLDISELDFIDTAGLSMLLIAHDTIQQKNAMLKVKGAQGQVEKMITFGQLNHLCGL